jgi:hypothetical protein
MHAAIWDKFDPEGEEPPPPADKPLTLASYMAAPLPEAFLEPIAVGDTFTDRMPLFLQVDAYINMPLEPTYQTAYRGMPAYWRGVLEGRESSS